MARLPISAHYKYIPPSPVVSKDSLVKTQILSEHCLCVFQHPDLKLFNGFQHRGVVSQATIFNANLPHRRSDPGSDYSDSSLAPL